MLVFVIRRSLRSVGALFAMSLLVFAADCAIGNPVDQPMWAQYLAFLDGVAHGDPTAGRLARCHHPLRLEGAA